MILSKFLEEQGIEVPRILDYTSNVFIPNGESMFIVKEFKKGLNFDRRDELGLNPYNFHGEPFINYQYEYLTFAITSFQAKKLGTQIELERNKLMNQYQEIISKNFYAWLEHQHFNRFYYESFPFRDRIGDIQRRDNWLLTPTGWVLIDL